MRENMDQNNSEYGLFSRSVSVDGPLQGVQSAGKTGKKVLLKKVAGKTRKQILNFKLGLEKLEMLNVRYPL